MANSVDPDSNQTAPWSRLIWVNTVSMPKLVLDVYAFHARIQNVLSEWVQLFYERREDPDTTKSGSSSARQRNAIEMAFRWRVDDGPTLNVGLVALWCSGDPDQYC